MRSPTESCVRICEVTYNQPGPRPSGVACGLLASAPQTPCKRTYLAVALRALSAWRSGASQTFSADACRRGASPFGVRARGGSGAQPLATTEPQRRRSRSRSRSLRPPRPRCQAQTLVQPRPAESASPWLCRFRCRHCFKHNAPGPALDPGGPSARAVEAQTSSRTSTLKLWTRFWR